MRLQIRGVPRNNGQPFILAPEQSGALLGRMEGDQGSGLAVPIPHIEQPSGGEPATICWSRRHLRFDFRAGAWYVTLLGKQKTLLDEHELAADSPTRLPNLASLRCGELTLQAAVDNPYETRAIGGASQRTPVVHGPFDTIAIRPTAQPQEPMERISMDNLTSQAKTMTDQMVSELDRVTTAVHDVQQRRSQAEQARNEAKMAVTEVRQATTPQQLQAAAERVRESAQRCRAAATRATSVAETVRRSLERARDIERSLKALATDTARAAARLPAHDAAGRILHGQTTQAEDEGRRRMGEIDELGQRSASERELAQAAVQAAQEAEEEALTLVSRREAEFRRKERALVYAKRYSIIGVIVISALLFGWLIGKLLEGNPSDPLAEPHSSLRLEWQQRSQLIQVVDHPLEVAIHLDVHRGIDQQLADEGEAL